MANSLDGLKPTVLAFIVVIVGVALLVAVANSATDVTEAKTVTNESLVLINGTPVFADNSQWDSVTAVSNITVDLVSGTNFTADLPAGSITLLAEGGLIPATGTYNVSYVYRQVGDSTSRTLVLLVILFGALAIFLAVLVAFSPTIREAMGDFMKGR